ncbi:MAG: aminotransferase class V-fold PLP-dependent enzyme [Myxococcales bacterium]|nr:aminotransferase class V-fold PLP-dependent enzyme [Myxococcales bacterium]
MRVRVELGSGVPDTQAALATAWARALSAAHVWVPSSPADADVVRVMREVGVELPLRVEDGGTAEITLVLQPVPQGPLRTVRDRLEPMVADALSQQGLLFDARPWASHFALAPDMVFLNNGSFGATPRSVLAAQRRLVDEMEAQPIRFMAEIPQRLRAAAERVAGMLGADPAGTVFVDNATSGVDTVLASIDWRPGDVIVATTHVYPAVHNGLRRLVERFGVQLVSIEIPFPVTGPEDVLARVRDAWPDGARLAVFDHITSATGLVLPVMELVAFARERGAEVLVDGAHAPGQVPVDLDELGADYWVGNCHKWLFTPKSCAVLHVAAAHRSQILPLVISHGFGGPMTSQFDFVGTRDYSPWLAVEAALDFVEEAGGANRIRAHNIRLRRRGTEQLGERLDLARGAPSTMLAAMESRPLPISAGSDALALNRRLWERHRVEAMIAPFADRLLLRTSAQLFNSMSDFERLGQALSEELSG